MLRLVVAAACVAYLVWFFYINRDALQVLFSVRLPPLALVIVLSVVFWLLYSYRFLFVLDKCSGRRLPFLPWFRISILATFLNMVFSQMGNVYRAVVLKRQYDISYTNYISSFASFAWMDTCINLIAAFLVILVFSSNLRIGQLRAWPVISALLVFVVFVPILAMAVLRRLRFKRSYLVWTKAKLSEVLAVSLNNMRDGLYVFRMVGLGLLMFFITILGYYILFHSFSVNLGLAPLAVFYVLLRISIFVNITPGNVGVLELAYGFLSEQMGIGMAQGIWVSVIARLLSTIIVVVLGLFFGGLDMLRHRKDYSKIEE